MADDDLDMRQFFFEEVGTIAAKMHDALLAHRSGAASVMSFEDVRRGFHNIKGGALQVSGCDGTGKYATLAERLAAALAQKTIPVSAGVLTLLANTARALTDQSEAVCKGEAPPDGKPELRARLQEAHHCLLALECGGAERVAALKTLQAFDQLS